MSRAFHENSGVAHSRHNAVAPHEVHLVGIGARHVFCQESALCQHAFCCLSVSGRVEVVEAVGQYAYGLKPLFECIAMCSDVHTVSQSAHHEHTIAAYLAQTVDEVPHDILPVDSAMARTHDVDDAYLVEVCRPFIIKDERSVGAFGESLGVCVVTPAENSHPVLLCPLVFLFGTVDMRLAVAYAFHQFWGGIGYDLTHVFAVVDDGCG